MFLLKKFFIIFIVHSQYKEDNKILNEFFEELDWVTLVTSIKDLRNWVDELYLYYEENRNFMEQSQIVQQYHESE